MLDLSASTPPRQVGLRIGGETRLGRGTEPPLSVVSPVDGRLLATVPVASAADVDDAVRASAEAQVAWGKLNVFERAKVCLKVAEVLESRAEELAVALTIEQGKSLHHEAKSEIEEAADQFRFNAEEAIRLTGETMQTRGPGKWALTLHRPLGVVASITAWNFPMLMPAELVAPAIVMGNGVVVKPSEWTPLAADALMDALDEAGVPKGLVNLVQGAGSVGTALVEHPLVGAIAFIGSNRTADRIIRSAGFKRTLIEASGNGPVVVLDDADVEAAAAAAVFGAFFCAGQVCCATERVIVDAKIHGAFVEAVARHAAEWRVGDPMDEAVRMGPLNNPPTAAKMDAHVADALAKGARLVTGGKRAAGFPTDLYYEPTVLDGVTAGMLAFREETFGPLVPITVADGDDAILAAANDTDLGLQAAVFTRDIGRAMRFAEELRAGGVVVNDTTDYWDSTVPFGGAAGTKTGTGRVGGRHSLTAFADLRSVIIDPGRR